MGVDERRVGPAALRGAWKAVLGGGAALLALYLFVPPLQGNSIVMNLLGLVPVAGIALGVRAHRPRSAAPWWCFALGFLLFWLGDVYTYSYRLVLGREVPFPSIGDAAYIAVYPALFAGVGLLVRRRRSARDGGSLIDAAVLSLGLALPSWVFLIAPYLHDHELGAVGRLVSVAYPLGDVLLVAAAARIALDGGRRGLAFNLFAGSISCLLVTDFVYGLMLLNGTYDRQLWLDAGWIATYVLWGAGALHPSMARLDRRAERETALTPLRLALLTGTSLIAPVLGLIDDLSDGDYDMAVVRGGSITLFALVVSRMAGLMRQKERSLERERLLSAAGAALVAATDREEIEAVAVESAAQIAGPGFVALFCEHGDGLEVRAAAPATARAAASVARAVLLARGEGGVAELDTAACRELGLVADRGRAPLFAVDGTEGAFLVVAGATVPPRATQSSLRALVTQVALALESAALTEEVHRRRGEARFGSLVRHASDLITVIAPDGTVTYQSPSSARILGYAPEELVGMRFEDLIDAADRPRIAPLLVATGRAPQTLECSLLRRDGHARRFEIQHTNLLDDEHVRGILLNCRDISERRAFEEQLTYQAFHDPVTGLANRALFGERVRHALARLRREDGGIAVIFLDLDDFKTINDSLGHAAGDAVLLEVAKRLSENTRATDTAARFGGDEFALLLDGIETLQEAVDTAERVLAALAAPMTVAHKELTLRCSIGISVAGMEGKGATDAEELIRDADAAMYIAKRDGKGDYRLFEPEMHEGVLARLELRADLQHALATDQFELHYQPVVRLEDGTISGVEALLRWHHPERGVIPPDKFVPLAEESGLIVPIGRWVLREGCRHAKRMRDAMPDGGAPMMSINLSLKQLQDKHLVSDVREALADAGLDPSGLTLEITETVLMADTEVAVARLRELKELGVRLALDDFGTGYSSLSYLSRFPVDVLKMDRSFLRDGTTPHASGLTTAVLALGTTLNLDVVAEGIELAGQWESLRDLGCQLGQGFYFARPMDGDAAIAHLASGAPVAGDAGDAARA